MLIVEDFEHLKKEELNDAIENSDLSMRAIKARREKSEHQKSHDHFEQKTGSTTERSCRVIPVISLSCVTTRKYTVPLPDPLLSNGRSNLVSSELEIICLLGNSSSNESKSKTIPKASEDPDFDHGFINLCREFECELSDSDSTSSIEVLDCSSNVKCDSDPEQETSEQGNHPFYVSANDPRKN